MIALLHIVYFTHLLIISLGIFKVECFANYFFDSDLYQNNSNEEFTSQTVVNKAPFCIF